MKYLGVIFFLISSYIGITALDNGQAKTPPMGWLAWERFQCNINCIKDPDDCISEKLFMEMADRFVSDGYREAGYQYVNIDDCWMARKRDNKGDMVADPSRFPRGIKFLANYMHQRDLKLGIYQDFGLYTCMGYPGIVGHMEQDALKFVEWDIDMLKLDACYSNISELEYGYVTMGNYLMRYHWKMIVYSCSWPYYELVNHIQPNYAKVARHCSMWRNYHDIHDSWKSIQATIDFFGDNQEAIFPYIGPGRWADADMLMIGNRHLTLGQSRIQMAVWSLIPAPLFMSNDLRSISSEAKKILLNKDVIAINQDKLGISGRRIYKEKGIEIWKRKILPTLEPEVEFQYAMRIETDPQENEASVYYSYVFLFINKQTSLNAVITFPLCKFGDCHKRGYNVTELFTGKVIGKVRANAQLVVTVPPMDAAIVRCEVLKENSFLKNFL